MSYYSYYKRTGIQFPPDYEPAAEPNVPANGAVDVDPENVNLAWNPVAGVNNWEVYLNGDLIDTQPAQPNVIVINLVDLVGPLQPGNYQWWVVGDTTQGPVWNFEAAFAYTAVFGNDLFEWWRMDLGVTLSTTNVKTVEGQHQGIILGNPDFGGLSYPLFVSESANLNNRPTAKWDDATNNQLEINFGTTIVDEGVLLLVYYTPTFGTAGNVLANGPIFGTADSWFSLYSDTTMKIRDGSAGLALTADTASNWAGAHAAIAIFDEVDKGRIYRDGGTNKKVSIQSGYNDAVSWKGIVFGPGVFTWKPETNYELAEVAVLSGVPSNTALTHWVNYVGTQYGLTVSAIS